MILAILVVIAIGLAAANERTRNLAIVLACSTYPAPCLRTDTHVLLHPQTSERRVCESKPYWGLPGYLQYQEYWECIAQAEKDGYVREPQRTRR